MENRQQQDAAYSLAKRLDCMEYIHTGYGDIVLDDGMKDEIIKVLAPMLEAIVYREEVVTTHGKGKYSAVVPLCTSCEFDFPESLVFPETEVPEALMTSTIGIIVARSLSILSALFSCGEDCDGFTLHHKDVMNCLDMIEGNLNIIDKLVNRAGRARLLLHDS